MIPKTWGQRENKQQTNGVFSPVYTQPQSIYHLHKHKLPAFTQPFHQDRTREHLPSTHKPVHIPELHFLLNSALPVLAGALS